MNTQRTAVVLLVAGLAAFGVWWQWPATPTLKRIPLTHRAAPTAPEEAEAPPVPPPPNEPAEPPPTPTVATDEPPPSPSPGFDPQADLSTAVPDFLRLLQSGDYVGLLTTYMPPEEGMTAEVRAAMGQRLQAEMQNPEAQQEIQKMVSAMQFIQNSPPVISGNGDRATYALPAGDPEEEVVFVKINGRWYRE